MKRKWEYKFKILDDFNNSYAQLYQEDNLYEIGIAKLDNPDALFALLHELGHIHNGFLICRQGIYSYNIKTGKRVKDDAILYEEIDAWIYAFNCIKRKYYGLMFVLAFNKLRKYFDSVSPLVISQALDYFQKVFCSIGIPERIVKQSVKHLKFYPYYYSKREFTLTEFKNKFSSA